MKLSIVTTLYYSEDWIEEFYARMAAAGDKVCDDIEIILVNDGSPDRSLQKAVRLQKADPRVVIVDLSRNFGHHKAIRAGLSQARGDYVFLIDCDLEEAPEILIEMWDLFFRLEDADVVYGVQKKRKGGWFERFSGYLFYKFMNLLITGGYYSENPLTARLMTRQFVESIMQFQEREYDLWCSFMHAGYKQYPLESEKGDKGKSQYTLYRKLKLATETITSSSARPLVAIFLLGLTISCFSFCYFIFLVINKIFFDVLMGWTSILASLWLLGGLLMLSLGVIGIYISKIYLETKKRPEFIVKRIYGGKETVGSEKGWAENNLSSDG